MLQKDNKFDKYEWLVVLENESLRIKLLSLVMICIAVLFNYKIEKRIPSQFILEKRFR